jgi:uncharacterized membrane protein
MFMIDDTNMPFLPPIVLGILGVVLLVTAVTAAPKEAKPDKLAFTPDPEKTALNKRLETMAWGFFLIMLGGYMFVPHTVVAKGLWPIAVGLIMLGLNLARYLNRIKMSGFTTFLGIVSVIGGLLQLAGMQSLESAVWLIVLGGYLVLKPWFNKRQIFGKAEMG